MSIGTESKAARTPSGVPCARIVRQRYVTPKGVRIERGLGYYKHSTTTWL